MLSARGVLDDLADEIASVRVLVRVGVRRVVRAVPYVARQGRQGGQAAPPQPYRIDPGLRGDAGEREVRLVHHRAAADSCAAFRPSPLEGVRRRVAAAGHRAAWRRRDADPHRCDHQRRSDRKPRRPAAADRPHRQAQSGQHTAVRQGGDRADLQSRSDGRRLPAAGCRPGEVVRHPVEEGELPLAVGHAGGHGPVQ